MARACASASISTACARPLEVATAFCASAVAERNSFSTRIASCVAVIFALMAAMTFWGGRGAPTNPNCSMTTPMSAICLLMRSRTSPRSASFLSP